MILDESCHLGRTFPEENTLSDIVLLFNGVLQEKIQAGEIYIETDEQIRLPKVTFQKMVEECKERFCCAWNKTYREMTFGEIYREVYEYMSELMLIEERHEDIIIKPVMGKIMGTYPPDFHLKGAKDE